MKDLQNPFWIKLKGILFLAIGIVCVVLLLLDDPQWHKGVLLAMAIWSFCRFYFFAFYVIEKYVDSKYKFSGLIDFAKYFFKNRKDS